MQKIYAHGDIITMTGEDVYAEAILVADDKIEQIGALSVLQQAAPDAKIVSLEGRTMMPAFLDGHSHLSAAAQYALYVDLNGTKSFMEITDRLRAFLHENPQSKVIVGQGYDHNFLQEQAHPDKRILDTVSEKVPIVIWHTSGHMGVANSATLALAKITAETKNPEGGSIGREAHSKEPNGYLEEAAANEVRMLPVFQQFDLNKALAKVQELYLANGIATVQDGGTMPAQVEMFREAGKNGLLTVDVVVYPPIMPESEAVIEKYHDSLGKYTDHVKIGGHKMVLDGSPQGRTAWMSTPYEGEEDYCGYPYVTNEVFTKMLQGPIAAGRQVLTHCNGDAAAQQLLDCYEAALASVDVPHKNELRPVMIHCQTVRDDQLERMAPLGMIPSFFVAHTDFWGDIHLKNLGQQRGSRISPVKSALDRQLIYNFHTDTPVIPPNLLHSVWCAVNRITQNGVHIGPEQSISVYDALKGITIHTAYAYFEEQDKGSIAPGKLADLVILDQNPLKADPIKIKEIQVLATIKNGEVVYQKR